MNTLGILLISFSPGLFWLWFFARLDRLRPSSRRWIALTYIYGILSVIPAALVSELLLPGDLFSPEVTLAVYSSSMLFVVGPVEETCKFLAVRLSVYRSMHFEEPMDGLVYGAAASLGFASLENLLYVMEYGPEVMVLRAPFSTLGHMVFGSMWGYGLGLNRRSHNSKAIWLGLVGAAGLHGVFNILVHNPAPWPGLLLIIAGGFCTYKLFRRGQRISPFRYQRNIPLIHCEGCNQLIRINAQFCSKCGIRQTGKHASIICGNCKSTNRLDASFCTYCGDRLLVKN